MPGMMDTLLNVGITPAVRNALAAAYTPAFAADTWPASAADTPRSFLMCRGQRLLTSNPATAPQVSSRPRSASGRPQRHTVAFPRRRSTRCVAPLSQSSDRGNPQEPGHSASANLSRSSWGTAVTIQAMVFGNLAGAPVPAWPLPGIPSPALPACMETT